EQPPARCAGDGRQEDHALRGEKGEEDRGEEDRQEGEERLNTLHGKEATMTDNMNDGKRNFLKTAMLGAAWARWAEQWSRRVVQLAPQMQHALRVRDELLNAEIFYTLREAQIVIESWRPHYNTIRPHASIGYTPPAPEVFVPAFAAWPAALRRPAPPATLAQRPTLN